MTKPAKREKPKLVDKATIKSKPHVTSRYFKFTGKDGIEYTLTKYQKLFVEEYLSNNTNGTNAAISAGYKIKKKNGVPSRTVASAIAAENLSKPSIYAYKTIKLKESGFNDKNVGKQHLFLVNQNSDLMNKRAAIDMYYKLTGAYAPEAKSIKYDLTQEILDRIIKD